MCRRRQRQNSDGGHQTPSDVRQTRQPHMSPQQTTAADNSVGSRPNMTRALAMQPSYASMTRRTAAGTTAPWLQPGRATYVPTGGVYETLGPQHAPTPSVYLRVDRPTQSPTSAAYSVLHRPAEAGTPPLYAGLHRPAEAATPSTYYSLNRPAQATTPSVYARLDPPGQTTTPSIFSTS